MSTGPLEPKLKRRQSKGHTMETVRNAWVWRSSNAFFSRLKLPSLDISPLRCSLSREATVRATLSEWELDPLPGVPRCAKKCASDSGTATASTSLPWPAP